MGQTPLVFISYSHDSDEHQERILELSERLRKDGIDTILDQYVNGSPDKGWPRWMLDGLDEASRVLLVCTPTYYSRFRGHEEPGKGKGVDWEGAVITQEIYHARSKSTRFIPVLFDVADASRIPEPVRSQTHYCLTSETAYQELYDALLGQAGVEPGTVREPMRKPRRRGKPMAFGDAPPQPGAEFAPPEIDLSHLPPGAQHFLGREDELRWLDAAWSDPSSQVVELAAPGGVGKTALVKRWLDNLKSRNWDSAQRVYAWSFYSQGTSDDRQASEDIFVSKALAWFGVDYETSLGPHDKGMLLAQALEAVRTLLVLDGLEPLQYPPGPMAGELRAPGLKALLTHLAATGHPGLCVLTSRERITDLDEYASGDRPTGDLKRRDLGNLSPKDGARLLHALGVRKAGAAAIEPYDPELKAASQEVQGHALTLGLLGHYLRLAYNGDCRCRDRVDLAEASAEIRGGHAFKVMAAYETWFAREGAQGARELAALRLLGFFDRPAAADSLAALRAPPSIPGLTESLMDLSESQWRICLKRLEDSGLVYPPPDRLEIDTTLDAHPLVREYLAERLRTDQPEAWREGHRRIYEQLEASCPHWPDGLDGLQPLYQAVAHGCMAGRVEEVCWDLYWERIARGNEAYSVRKLGAFGAELAAVSCFFVEPWKRAHPDISVLGQAWLLNEAAMRLRALGRLDEALEPTLTGAEIYASQQDLANAVAGYSNLSELDLSLGRVSQALVNAARSVSHADRIGDAPWLIISRVALADALHQHGEDKSAAASFAEAETWQAKLEPQYPVLYSVQGFWYCDLLLAEAERAAWRRPTANNGLIRRCIEVAERATKTVTIAKDNSLSLLTIALDHLTLARCALIRAILGNKLPTAALGETDRAVDGLRAAAAQEFLARGLLTRAWLYQNLDNSEATKIDLAEAQRISQRGNMRLNLADCHLYRARLFKDRAALAEARRLIEECGYGRRLPELADADDDAQRW